jgi:hypothetical protein
MALVDYSPGTGALRRHRHHKQWMVQERIVLIILQKSRVWPQWHGWKGRGGHEEGIQKAIKEPEYLQDLQFDFYCRILILDMRLTFVLLAALSTLATAITDPRQQHRPSFGGADHCAKALRHSMLANRCKTSDHRICRNRN